jgi:hypothetical protein
MFWSIAVDLTMWLLAMFALGLATMGALFAFLFACEKV